MSGYYNQRTGHGYSCVDQAPETMPGLHGNVDGALFYFVQASCGSLGRCPDYIEAVELTCVVCSI